MEKIRNGLVQLPRIYRFGRINIVTVLRLDSLFSCIAARKLKKIDFFLIYAHFFPKIHCWRGIWHQTCTGRIGWSWRRSLIRGEAGRGRIGGNSGDIVGGSVGRI
jgi:hypothetical protein